MPRNVEFRRRAATRAYKFCQDDEAQQSLDAATPTAMKNLLAAATAAQVPEQLHIFLLYQSKRGVLPTRLVERLKREIEAIQGQGDQRMAEVRDFLANLCRLQHVTQGPKQQGRRR